ncbi:unnamed protein product [Orchesella dallaii]|uniref:Uncharacterized protein n=1 Tax=Orchesella dallaii TaxID=48710 RepID=A0ABP1RUV9_9HEXA
MKSVMQTFISSKQKLSNKLFSKYQDAALLQRLRKCRHVSVVVPEKKRHEYYVALEKEKLGHVSLGKEILYKEDKGVVIEGWVSRTLNKHLMLLHDAGIWNYIRHVYGDRMLKSKVAASRDLVRSPSLNGNIVIIFAVIGAGHFAGLLCFLVEIRNGIRSKSVSLTELLNGIAITGVTAPPKKSSIETFYQVVDKDATVKEGRVVSRLNFFIISPLRFEFLENWRLDKLKGFNDTDKTTTVFRVPRPDFQIEFFKDVDDSFTLAVHRAYSIREVGGHANMDYPDLLQKLSASNVFICPKRDLVPKFSMSFDVAVEREITKCNKKVVFVGLENRVDNEFQYLSSNYKHKSFFKGVQTILPDFTAWHFDNGMGSTLPYVFTKLMENGIYHQVERFYD